VLDEKHPQGAARQDLVPPHQRPAVRRRGRGRVRGRRRRAGAGAGARLSTSSSPGGGVGVGRHSVAARRNRAEQEPAVRWEARTSREGEGAVRKISAIFFSARWAPRQRRRGWETRTRSSSWMKWKPECEAEIFCPCLPRSPPAIFVSAEVMYLQKAGL
jgi:hypothetical protein